MAAEVLAVDRQRADDLEAIANRYNALPLLTEEIEALRHPTRESHRSDQCNRDF